MLLFGTPMKVKMLKHKKNYSEFYTESQFILSFFEKCALKKLLKYLIFKDIPVEGSCRTNIKQNILELISHCHPEPVAWNWESTAKQAITEYLKNFNISLGGRFLEKNNNIKCDSA